MRVLARLAATGPWTVTLAAPAVAQDSTIGRPAAIIVSGPREGDRAPDFSLPWASKDTAGVDPWFNLSFQRGKVVVLAFYPKDFTSGCTAEMRTFSDQYEDLFGGTSWWWGSAPIRFRPTAGSPRVWGFRSAS
jgi:hypothetical protein